MPSESHESSQHFSDLVSTGREYSAEEVTKLLASFHGVNATEIQRVFKGLERYSDATVTFRDGLTAGFKMLVMELKDTEGKSLMEQLIIPETGQPTTRVG